MVAALKINLFIMPGLRGRGGLSNAPTRLMVNYLATGNSDAR